MINGISFSVIEYCRCLGFGSFIYHDADVIVVSSPIIVMCTIVKCHGMDVNVKGEPMKVPLETVRFSLVVLFNVKENCIGIYYLTKISWTNSRCHCQLIHSNDSIPCNFSIIHLFSYLGNVIGVKS